MSALRSFTFLWLATLLLVNPSTVSSDSIPTGFAYGGPVAVAPLQSSGPSSSRGTGSLATGASFAATHCSQPGGLNNTIYMEFSILTSPIGTRTSTCDIAAVCVDGETGLYFTNVDVEWEVEVIPYSGFHDHHDSQRPTGSFDFPVGNTGSTGIFQNVFTTPEVAGILEWTLTCSHPFIDFGDPAKFQVEISTLPERLHEMGASDWYDITPATPEHPHKMSGERRTVGAAYDFAKRYRYWFPGADKITFDLISLPWGGLFKFDPGGTWGPGHSAHRLGVAVDFTAGTGFPFQHRVLRRLASWAGFQPIMRVPGAPDYFHAAQTP